MDNNKKTIHEKIFNAKQEFGKLVKDKKAFGYKYADLGAVLSAIEQPLWNNGLDIIQKLNNDTLTTYLVDIQTSEMLEMCTNSIIAPEIKGANAMQNWGAGITYMKRYHILTACGLAPEDDDAENANNVVKLNTTSTKQNTTIPTKNPIILTKQNKNISEEHSIPLITEILNLIAVKNSALSLHKHFKAKAKLDYHVTTNFSEADLLDLQNIKDYLIKL